MNILDTKVYRWLETATDFLLLNLLWLAACLPVVTAPPATAAMFGVVRDRVRGDEGGLFRTFVFRFRQNFGQSLAVGALWALLGAALYADFLIANGLEGGAQILLRSLLFVAALLYALASVWLFPVMVHYDTTWTGVLKNAVLLGVGRLPTTLLCLLTVTAAATLAAVVPFLVLVMGSVAAYAVYRLCDRDFGKIDGP